MKTAHLLYCLALAFVAFVVAAPVHSEDVENFTCYDTTMEGPMVCETPEPQNCDSLHLPGVGYDDWLTCKADEQDTRIKQLEQAVFGLETLVLRLYVGDTPGEE